MIVSLLIDPGALAELLHLGDRRVVGASWRESRWDEDHVQSPSEAPQPGRKRIHSSVHLLIDAPDAPDGCAEMNPMYRVDSVDHVVTMEDPGWVIE